MCLRRPASQRLRLGVGSQYLSPEDPTMKARQRNVVTWGLVVAVTGLVAVARAQDARQIRPEVDLLKQSVSEKLQAAAEMLGLTQEQRDKIKEVHRSFEARRQAMREQRRALLQSDLRAISESLTPEQREKAQAFLEDQVESRGSDAASATDAASIRETFAQKLRAAENLSLTSDQRTRIVERLTSSYGKYREQRRARRDLIEAEYKAIA